MPRKFDGGINLQNQKLINLADGTVPTDAVNLGQLQAAIRGLDWKNSVRAATTANITLTNTQSVDTVSLAVGDRVLVKNQTTASTNGIYIVATGAWTRATDYDDGVEVTSASAIPVEEGATNGDAVFILTTDGEVTVGTTSLTFTRLGGSGVTYTADANGGLSLTGSSFSIKLDTGSGLALGPGGIKLDPTQFAALGLLRKAAGSISNASATVAVAHGLNTLDVLDAQVIIVSTGEPLEVDWVVTNASTVTYTFSATPSSGQYRYVIAG